MADDPDEGGGAGLPLPPDDRLWRHPSEVRATSAATSTPADDGTPQPSRRRGRRALVAIAVISSVTGTAATVVSLAALGVLSPRVVERVERVPSSSVLAVTTVGSARSVATAVSPAVVEVTAVHDGERRRGSGVVLRSDGLIVTSTRLVEGATSVMVTWPSGRTEESAVEGSDALTGVAALSAGGADHPTAQMTTTPTEPGAVAITVGARSGSQGPSLVQGHVSATSAHAHPDQGRLLGLIETDQPVPDWADGGALIDDDGMLIGIGLAVPEKGATGWAVPIAAVVHVADDLVRFGRVDRGWLGIRGTDADPLESRPAGLVIDEMAAGSPAGEAGLRTSDLIVSVGGTDVRSLADIQATLTLTRPGEEIVIEWIRDDTSDTTTVTLGQAPG